MQRKMIRLWILLCSGQFFSCYSLISRDSTTLLRTAGLHLPSVLIMVNTMLPWQLIWEQCNDFGTILSVSNNSFGHLWYRPLS
ncbi:uncharacterized protein BT62DRAFT_134984 [Guyanagaster necrorhizus]|uniref:Uncharacterized protein n=1 Tax=Guyanagaster necrorhizus TaxID=856835 RepID=A0A9P7VSN0_9AGAR|nr:uncharacterized protein BT62DRAFT_134984 [Guyanagaster necrorhizus MCA 3950]KAG7446698.1 hypothetical protein BT62DRAFT_134984 [Guyanagaster necrorhizus MCA 3950]